MSEKVITRALEHRDDAWGLRCLQHGFAFEREMDLRFALGWPSFVSLLKEHPSDEAPAVNAFELLETDYPFLETAYPAETAARLARLLLVHKRFEADSIPAEHNLSAQAREALATSGPLTEPELRKQLPDFLLAPFHNTLEGSALIRLLEAMCGPRLVVDTVIGAIEALAGHQPAGWIYELDALGLMLLRLPESEADAARLRLGNALEAVPAINLGCILQGAAGNNAHNLPQHVLDDPEFVVQARRRMVGVEGKAPPPEPFGDLPNPRLVFLGSDEVYWVECQVWRKYRLFPAAKSQRMILERFGVIRSPYSVHLALAMAHRSRVQGLAKYWFKDHAEYARPFLTKLAAKGDQAASRMLAILV